MRVKSEIWVQSYLRTLMGHGVAGYVVRRGDADAGAIFIRINKLDGTSCAYGPAAAGLDALDGGRGWVSLFDAGGQSDDAVDNYLRDEVSMDPDIWIVEVEDRAGRHFMDGWLVA